MLPLYHKYTAQSDRIGITSYELTKTFTLIARPDTHYFIAKELPAYIRSLSSPPVRLGAYIRRLRSGEYIPKDSYADGETDYVYLTIGQFSGPSVSFEGLTFLDPVVGERYGQIRLRDGCLVITRSGTVGVAHVFRAPDNKVYIPSHHLAVAEVPEDALHSVEYLRMFLQSEFARKYFWAFASGKGQKEISNWSIKSVPVPQCPDPKEVERKVLALEREINVLRQRLTAMAEEKDKVFNDAVRAVDVRGVDDPPR